MKKNKIILILAIVAMLVPCRISAQYTSIVNQAANILQTAVTGGFRYKGFVDASYTGGFGELQANFLGFSTVHGFQYADWFFMGAGLGVDYVYSSIGERYDGVAGGRGVRTKGAMVPVFTDFRFNIGKATSASFFIDVKAGGSFLMGRKYLAIENGYISGSEYFMLKPSVGVRVPVGKGGRQAVNIGLTYQLLTCNYWYGHDGGGTLNSLGATASFEW